MTFADLLINNNLEDCGLYINLADAIDSQAKRSVKTFNY